MYYYIIFEVLRLNDIYILTLEIMATSTKKLITINPAFLNNLKSHAVPAKRTLKLKPAPTDTTIDMKKKMMNRIKEFQQNNSQSNTAQNNTAKSEAEQNNTAKSEAEQSDSFDNEFSKSLMFLNGYTKKNKKRKDVSQPVIVDWPEPEKAKIIEPPAIPIIANPSIPIIANPSIPIIANPSIPIIANPSIPIIANPSIPIIAKPVIISKEPPYGNLKNGTKHTFRNRHRVENINNNNTNINDNNNINRPEEKTHKVKYLLGKHNKKVSVLIKNDITRKRTQQEKGALKTVPIYEIRAYLQKNNLIKIGSEVTENIMREMYESAMLTGRINNINNVILLNNYTKSEENINR
uniref:Uncharacterized protein n=1 Tax=viral metagenome TaxID=1070528 RepID=A0A6C0HNU3_9ZZZZ